MIDYPDNKTRAQFMQELATCWQMIEQLGNDKAYLLDAKAEIERLREENALLTKGWQPETPTALLAEIARLRDEREIPLDRVAYEEGRAQGRKEAADEIERLRENRDYWMKSCQEAQESWDTASVFLAAAEIEIKRLRELIRGALGHE